MNGNGGSGTSDKSLLSVGGQSYVTPGGVDKTRAALTWCVTRPPSWKSSTPSSPTRSARRRKRGSAEFGQAMLQAQLANDEWMAVQWSNLHEDWLKFVESSRSAARTRCATTGWRRGSGGVRGHAAPCHRPGRRLPGQAVAGGRRPRAPVAAADGGCRHGAGDHRAEAVGGLLVLLAS